MRSTILPEIDSDLFTGVLAYRGAILHESLIGIGDLLTVAAAEDPLPADQPAVALW